MRSLIVRSLTASVFFLGYWVFEKFSSHPSYTFGICRLFCDFQPLWGTAGLWYIRDIQALMTHFNRIMRVAM